MIIRRERYYIKQKGKGILAKKQQRRMISYWLLGIIPIFIDIKILKGDWM